MEVPLADLDPAATLARAASATRRRRAVEVEDLEVLSHWAMLHGDPAARRERGDRFRRFGGEGTPELWELATAEIAIERQVHPDCLPGPVANRDGVLAGRATSPRQDEPPPHIDRRNRSHGCQY